MSGSLARKACAWCGEESLVQEWACWACGTPFGSPASGPTLPPVPRRIGGQAVAVVAGLVVLLIGIGLGFWMGRASQARALPDRAAATPAVPASVEMIPPPSLSGGRPDTPIRLPPPVGARPPADPWRRALPAPPSAPAPLFPPPSLFPPRTNWPPPGATPPGAAAVPRASPPPPAAPLRAQRPPAPAAAPAAKARSRARAGEALVLVQNSGQVPLRMTLDGSDTHTVLLAPGASVPIPVPAGDYRVTLIAGGRREVWRSMTLKAGEEYPIRFP